MLALILDLVSVMMIASLAGQVKPLVLSPSCFFQWTNQRGRKEPTLLCSSGVVYLSHPWRGLSFISWAQWAHKWTDSGCRWRPCVLTSDLTVNIFRYIIKRTRLPTHGILFISFFHSSRCDSFWDLAYRQPRTRLKPSLKRSLRKA